MRSQNVSAASVICCLMLGFIAVCSLYCYGDKGNSTLDDDQHRTRNVPVPVPLPVEWYLYGSLSSLVRTAGRSVVLGRSGSLAERRRTDSTYAWCARYPWLICRVPSPERR